MVEICSKSFDALDAVIISNPADIKFLTGFYCADALCVKTDELCLITDSRYTDEAKRAFSGKMIDNGSYIKNAARLVKEKNLVRVGIQGSALSAADYRFLQSQKFELTDIGNQMQKIRCHKKEDEIKKIVAAQNITEKAFEKVILDIKEGVSEKKLRAALEFYMLSLGADGLAFETIVASGQNGACPHATPSDRKIKKGDFITFDFGARLDGYCSDMTRTVALGEVSKEQEEIYNTVLSAHEEAAKMLAPGVKCADVEAKARQVLKEKDLEKYFTHSLGHGVGLEIHELPRLSMGVGETLEIGDVVTIEPGVYISGKMGVRIENMYVITASGSESLTKTDKKLIKL